MKKKNIIAISLTALICVGMLNGCGDNKGLKETNSDGKIQFSVSNWPDDTDPESVKTYEKLKNDFEELNSDLSVVPDTYVYNTQTFNMKANAGEIPTLFETYFTEIDKIVDAGYAADITEYMKKYGYLDGLNPSLLDLVTGKDGKVYGIPYTAYAQGLYINKSIFKQAGLVNEDGSIKYPNTYQEVAEFSKIIRDKTGKAGIVLATADNCGGWHFMNIAWSYGVEFMKKEGDKWKATFDSPEMKEAVKYVYDLKWKYNALPENPTITNSELKKVIGTYQAAMMIANPPRSELATQYGMKINDIMLVSMPGGPNGRFSQMGGGVDIFSKYATPKQIDAAFKWLEYRGISPELSDSQTEKLEANYQRTIENGGIVLNKNAFNVWTSTDRLSKENMIASKYSNVKDEDYANYYAFDGVEIKPEEPVCCQELYTILDGVIQEVITNKDVNINELVKTANDNFQANHLNSYVD